MKWIKLIKFIRKHRNESGCASFTIVTTQSEVIINTNQRLSNAPYDQIRIPQKNLGYKK